MGGGLLGWCREKIHTVETSHVRVLAVRHLDLWQSWQKEMPNGITSGRSWLSGFARELKRVHRGYNTACKDNLDSNNL